jgi:hypothetical protein
MDGAAEEEPVMELASSLPGRSREPATAEQPNAPSRVLQM